MDEMTPTGDRAPEKPTTRAARFGWFAAGHFIYSFALTAIELPCVSFALKMSSVEPWLQWLILVPLMVILLGAYFPIGAYIARRREWTAPRNWREGLLAVLLPALVAWAWAAVVLAALLDVSDPSGRVPLLGLVFFPSVTLAAPSSGFVLLSLILSPTYGMQGNEVWWWVTVAFLAGLLPPLLFALGSFWQARRKKKE